jgi:hypothetical protein
MPKRWRFWLQPPDFMIFYGGITYKCLAYNLLSIFKRCETTQNTPRTSLTASSHLAAVWCGSCFFAEHNLNIPFFTSERDSFSVYKQLYTNVFRGWHYILLHDTTRVKIDMFIDSSVPQHPIAFAESQSCFSCKNSNARQTACGSCGVAQSDKANV